MTLAPDDLPQCMARELERFGPDLDEAAGIFHLAAGPHYTMSELIEHMPEAIAIVEMQRYCARESVRLGEDIAKELAR